MVIQAHSYQLFDFVQSVHYIMPANDQIMSYEHKLCIQTWAMVSFKPEDLTTYIVPVVVKLFIMEEQFNWSCCSTSYLINSLLLLRWKT